MTAKKKAECCESPEPEDVYFVISQDELANYGSMNGETKEQLEDALTIEEIRCNNLVFIKGRIVEPKLVFE